MDAFTEWAARRRANWVRPVNSRDVPAVEGFVANSRETPAVEGFVVNSRETPREPRPPSCVACTLVIGSSAFKSCTLDRCPRLLAAQAKSRRIEAGYQRSEQTRARMSASAKARPRRGPPSATTEALIGLANTGRPVSDATRALMAAKARRRNLPRGANGQYVPREVSP